MNPVFSVEFTVQAGDGEFRLSTAIRPGAESGPHWYRVRARLFSLPGERVRARVFLRHGREWSLDVPFQLGAVPRPEQVVVA